MSSLNSFTRYGLCIPSSPSPNLDNFYVDYICSQGHSLQIDISAQADFAVSHYRETTPVAERSATEIWNVMTKAQERTIKSIEAAMFIGPTSPAMFLLGTNFMNLTMSVFFYLQNLTSMIMVSLSLPVVRMPLFLGLFLIGHTLTTSTWLKIGLE